MITNKSIPRVFARLSCFYYIFSTSFMRLFIAFSGFLWRFDEFLGNIGCFIIIEKNSIKSMLRIFFIKKLVQISG